MSDIKKRRRLSADQKWQIFKECQQPDAKVGEILRRYGLYSSDLVRIRKITLFAHWDTHISIFTPVSYAISILNFSHQNCAEVRKKRIPNDFPTEGVGKKSKKSFKDITRNALKKKRKR